MIKGTCWVADDYVMAYDIIIQEYWTSEIDPEENSKWVMAGVKEEFNKENAFKDKGYTFIVAAHNFAGGGKSIEHVITGLRGAGIQAVFATSFARLQFRNATNYGLPFVTSANISDGCSTGDELEYDPESGTIKNLTKGTTFQSVPAAPFVAEVAKAGGLMNFVRDKIAKGEPIE
ncbi:3-isopropylmalate dehydratase small subunit [Costertonia aggregata]|uniref:3-isopropylmalate dehydratase n=1 Tax=Costertonia aggregata TaxID=343403 RepID=A0A7H9ANS4_9FLAO|nr:3-isopropylmalate dehydratase [Costertonia aggregata]QLG45033.1 3-isopropylmalate dehydratase [Costertonia aggregata]